MKIIYTDHAEENIKERKLSKDVIESVIGKPEKTVEAKFGRKIAQRLVGRKLLRVIYEQEEDNIYIIVTAYYTKPDRYTVK